MCKENKTLLKNKKVRKEREREGLLIYSKIHSLFINNKKNNTKKDTKGIRKGLCYL